MIESKEQANRSSICLIEKYTKQIVVYICIEVYVHEKENKAQKKGVVWILLRNVIVYSIGIVISRQLKAIN